MVEGTLAENPPKSQYHCNGSESAAPGYVSEGGGGGGVGVGRVW